MMWAGTGFHQLFESGVSSEEFLEQFLEYFSMNRLHRSSRALAWGVEESGASLFWTLTEESVFASAGCWTPARVRQPARSRCSSSIAQLSLTMSLCDLSLGMRPVSGWYFRARARYAARMTARSA